MTLKRIAWYLLIIFLIAFVIRAPVEAAHVVRVTGESAGHFLSTVFIALTKFIRSLF